MSEAKRVTLTTISSSVSSSLMAIGTSSSSLRFGGDFLAPTDKSAAVAAAGSTSAGSGAKGANKTLRLKVELFETDSNKYPEFDYTKLTLLEKKKLKKLSKKTNGFSDPFEDNDDDVARIAKQLEMKYGNAYSNGRSKNKRDDVDLGLGYDESDSFIDNTEAYDELIPDEVETIEGGFYINSGALEFKKLHTESMTTKTDEIIKMPNRPKKRVIGSSSSEASSSEDDDEAEASAESGDEDGDDDGTGEETSAETSKSKSSTATAGSSKKKLKSSASTTSSNPAKKKATSAENGNVTHQKKRVKSGQTSAVSAGSSSNSPKPATDDVATDSEREHSIKKVTSIKDMLKAQRDKYLKARTSDVKSSNGELKSKSSEDDDDEDDDDDDTTSDESGDDESGDNSDSNQSESKEQKEKRTASSNEESQGNEKLRTTDTKLPELEADVLTSVVEFRDSAKLKNLIGKRFQFNDQLVQSFLKIDESLLCIDKNQRNMVFAHFEYHLALPKYFFLRKAKQLRIKEEKMKSMRSFSQLQKAVTEVMPALLATYNAETAKYNECLAAKVDPLPKMPQRKFPWNSHLRNLLYDVYQVRWTSYAVLGTRKESLEEFITSYMSKKVVEIWPKGWMRHEELQREIDKRKNATKKAKEKSKPAVVVSQKAQPASGNVTTSTAGSAAAPNSQQFLGTFNKQYEEIVIRSNSDTDSVASSNTSSSLKRKNTDGTVSKQGKSKAAKTNGDPKTHAAPLKTILPEASSSKKHTDYVINSISPTSAAQMVASSSIFSSTVAATSQPLKHSTNTHVIDLDYCNAKDILHTTQQIQQAAVAAAAAAAAASAATSSASYQSQLSISNVTSLGGSSNSLATSLRRESSGDSEIEIVGEFPARKPEVKNRNNTPTPNQMYSDKTFNHNNNNNISNNKRGKKSSASSALHLTGVSVNQLVSNIVDLRDDLEIKPIPTHLLKQQQQHQQPSSSSSSMSSHLLSHQ